MQDKKYDVTVNQDWCKACGICIALCPTGVFEADAEGKAIAAHPERCIGCRICVLQCPDFCIAVEEARRGK